MTITKSQLRCLVLAAGEAKRFGANKCLTPLGDLPLLVHAVNLAQSVAPTYVAIGAYAEDNQAALEAAGSKAKVIYCPQWQDGPGATIAYSVSQIPEAVGLMIMLADQYAVTEPDLRSLVALWLKAPHNPACAQYNGTIGSPAIFPNSSREQLYEIPAAAGAKTLLKRLPNLQTIAMPNAAWDLDTPADLLVMRTHWQGLHAQRTPDPI